MIGHGCPYSGSSHDSEWHLRANCPQGQALLGWGEPHTLPYSRFQARAASVRRFGVLAGECRPKADAGGRDRRQLVYAADAPLAAGNPVISVVLIGAGAEPGWTHR